MTIPNGFTTPAIHALRAERGSQRGKNNVARPPASSAASGEPRSARKAWIAGVVNPSGILTVDDGAADALRRGTSLLPAGVVAVEGVFERGDAVIVRTRSGSEAGRGLSAYSSADIRRIAGYKSGEIAGILGYRGRDEIIHRDDLVVTENR